MKGVRPMMIELIKGSPNSVLFISISPKEEVQKWLPINLQPNGLDHV